jgi:hypothetical protein
MLKGVLELLESLIFSLLTVPPTQNGAFAAGNVSHSDEPGASFVTHFVVIQPWSRHLQVVGSRPDTLLHNFATLLPGATSSDFQRIVELKVLLGF